MIWHFGERISFNIVCKEMPNPNLTLGQNLERTVKVLRKPRIQIVGHVRGVDLNVSDSVHQDQPEVTAARKTPDCDRSRASMDSCSIQQLEGERIQKSNR